MDVDSTRDQSAPPARAERARTLLRPAWLAAIGLGVIALVALGVAWHKQPKNVALGRPAAARGAGFGTTPAGAVDGVRYGWLGFHSAGAETEWWSVDLGRVYAIERVEAYGRPDCCFDQSVPLAFEVSLDGANYSQVASRSEAFSQFDPWVIRAKNLAARFVRFSTLRKTVLVLGEVEVYGRAM
jgi:hypothetical protein